MENKLETKYPCYYAICASMPCGPLAIPEQHCLSEEAAINYILEQMEGRIRGRAIIEWGKDSNKKPTLFWRDKNGKPYAAI
jgi:hypothetical protein